MISVVYEVASGRIRSLLFVADGNTANKQAGLGLATLMIPDWIDDQAWYVVNADRDDVPSDLAPRPVVEVAPVTLTMGTAPVAITGSMPAGTTATIDGAPAEISEAAEVLHTPAVTGTHYVAVAPPWPYRPASFVLTVEG